VKAINRKILICISLIILTIPAILIWYNFSWFINRSDLTATEVVAFLNEFRSNNPDHPSMQNARNWGVFGSRVEVSLMDYNREQIALFRREVINSRWITFYNLRGNTNQRSEPLRTDPLLGQHFNMAVTEINQEQGYVVVTISNSAESEYYAAIGSGFWVEVFRRGDWWLVPGHYAFLDTPTATISPGESAQVRRNLKWRVGSLDPGLYRIRDSVSWWQMYTWFPVHMIEDNYKHEIVAEFYWE